jgi:hypothetical protein
MCRKWTSSLFPQFIVVLPSQITPPLSSSLTYREFESSPKRFRGFCSKCGSPLIWRSEDNTATWDLYLGTIDEKWLVGEKVPGSEKKTEFGIRYDRTGGVGKIVGTPNQYQYWCENAIEGVTDLLHGGERYLTEKTEGKALP